ncbi:MAG TPA: hypothetical protein VGG72_34920 [Bryobacteraceae bacterium]|jgi:hypothetical protein
MNASVARLDSDTAEFETPPIILPAKEPGKREKISTMCDRCAQLHAEYQATAEGLFAAQRELAGYEAGRDDGSFIRLWNNCLAALRGLWRLREEMLAHTATHRSDAMSTHG